MEHCTESLELTPHDVKALFRRSQAYEAANDPENSFKDAALAAKLDPKNAPAAKAAQRLMAIVASRLDHQRSTAGVSQDLLKTALTETGEQQMRAVKNLVALAREPAGSAQLMAAGAVQRLLTLLAHSDTEAVTAVLHIYAALAVSSAARVRDLLL